MDFQTIIYDIVGALLAIATALASYFIPILAKRLEQKWGLQVDAIQRDHLVAAIDNGLAYGAQVVKDRAIPKGPEAADAQLAAAKLYVQETAPDALAHFEVPPASAKLEKKIISQMATTSKPTTEGHPEL